MTNRAAKGNGKVAIGWIHPGQVYGEFALSLADTIMQEGSRGRNRILNLIGTESSPRIAEGRSQVVDGFLRTEAEWLLMIDSDMGWDYGDFCLLLDHADAEKRPIIGGLCFGGGRSMGIFPTLYKLTQDEDGYGVEKIPEYPRNALVQIDATGAAFLMVHRKVFAHMLSVFGKTGDYNNPYPWFAETVYKGKPIGEDITFCTRARSLGYPIFVHTGVRIRHMKLRALDEQMYMKEK